MESLSSNHLQSVHRLYPASPGYKAYHPQMFLNLSESRESCYLLQDRMEEHTYSPNKDNEKHVEHKPPLSNIPGYAPSPLYLKRFPRLDQPHQ